MPFCYKDSSYISTLTAHLNSGPILLFKHNNNYYAKQIYTIDIVRHFFLQHILTTHQDLLCTGSIFCNCIRCTISHFKLLYLVGFPHLVGFYVQ